MKKVIVIGATSGIGKGLAEYYSANGWIVGVTGRRENLLQELKQNNKNIYTKSFDILSLDSAAKLLELINEMQGVDLAIISSGIGFVNHNLDPEVELNTAQTNAIGFTRMADFLYGYFNTQGYGHLAAISSIASIRGIYMCPAYSASKAYVSTYLEALRSKAVKEKKKIKVSTILPGFVDTPLLGKDTPTFWKSEVKTVVKQITTSLRRKRRKIYVTRRWRWVTFIWRLLPSYIHERIL
ncbi:MAG: SDR family NAD(P)-dependent oxidoreductase [Prevotellaceae bacterium]|jgi:short-subunit dehydrogenase|nr:SDR family NAD(P)-dependent oxidoreductase [Prevotellaceae bacterium]